MSSEPVKWDDDGSQACAATPRKELMQQLMDPRVAKTEREHFAAHHIEEQDRDIQALEATVQESEDNAEHCGQAVVRQVKQLDEHAATITRLRELLTRAARRIPKTRGAGLRGTEPNPLRVEIDAELKEKT